VAALVERKMKKKKCLCRIDREGLALSKDELEMTKLK
jgi:hypothetical protein